MRYFKLALTSAFVLVGSVASVLSVSSGTVAAAPAAAFCSNTGCDYPGQANCPYLKNAVCGNTENGCQGWVTCNDT